MNFYCCHHKNLLLDAIVLAAILLVVVALGESQSINKDSGTVKDATSSRLPRLFDFQNFVQRFSKHYSSKLEWMARRKYFMARAFRVFVVAVKYKWRQVSHFLSFNPMSDYSPMEIKQMQNNFEARGEMRKQRQLAMKEGRKLSPAKKRPDSESGLRLEELDASDEEIAEKLEDFQREHHNDPVYEELLAGSEKVNTRRKRSSVDAIDWHSRPDGYHSQQVEMKPRELSLEELYERNPPEPGQELSNEAHDGKVRLKIASNNPNYEPIELPSRGLDDQQENINWFRIRGKNDPDVMGPNSFFQSIQHLLDPSNFQESITEYIPKIVEANSKILADDSPIENGHGKPDEIFVDHRGSCMGMVRQQGKCGSCYAFAATALLEWLYCKRTGSYTPFSEQYVIDCGTYVKGLNGCDGGDRLSVVEFFHNFGAELRISYPYKMRDQQCPYARSTDLKTTGYVRPNLGAAVVVPRRKWANYIKFTPLMTSIFTNADFSDYGGGVHLLQDCDKSDGHAMVLVGRGREDGQEYWLMRNSYSVGWGEMGYYKLSRRSNPECIYTEGYTFGTTNGVKFTAKPEVNKQNDHSHILRLNEQNLKADLANGLF